MTQAKVFVAGHRGMVGSAITRILNEDRSKIVITASRNELDLTNQKDVHDFFVKNQFDQVYLAAAKVGGILANNSYPADFIYQNLIIQANVIHSAHLTDVNKLLFLGSSCIYPKLAEQPINEAALLTGKLEETNEPYAIAKIAGIKLCESYNRQYSRDYRSVMPTNLYGPGDNYHPNNSHVIPALIRRFHEAKISKAEEVIAWGSGKPMREFLFVDDMANASIFVMNLSKSSYKKNTKLMSSHLNVGTGIDCTIKELTEKIAKIVGFTGEIIWDSTKPDGAPRKLLDVGILKSLGWDASVSLENGIELAYKDFCRQLQFDYKKSYSSF
jgi:GDP-L-fucose synthase